MGRSNGWAYSFLAENSGGIDKYCTFGPNCTYLGKKIPTFVSHSENGSITSKILASVMKHLDDHATIDHSEATLFLLVNGHGSPFGLEFLRYVNDPDGQFALVFLTAWTCGRWETVHNKMEHWKWHWKCKAAHNWWENKKFYLVKLKSMTSLALYTMLGMNPSELSSPTKLQFKKEDGDHWHSTCSTILS